LEATAAPGEQASPKKPGATVRAVFLYPPSETFSSNPDGWWSWPGSECDAEGRQEQYMATLVEIKTRLGMKVIAENRSIADNQDAQKVIEELRTSRPDGLLLIMSYNRSLPQADLLLGVGEELGLPVVFFIGFGVRHGSVTHYCRPDAYMVK
jgi:hypothetical protein